MLNTSRPVQLSCPPSTRLRLLSSRAPSGIGTSVIGWNAALDSPSAAVGAEVAVNRGPLSQAASANPAAAVRSIANRALIVAA